MDVLGRLSFNTVKIELVTPPTSLVYPLQPKPGIANVSVTVESFKNDTCSKEVEGVPLRKLRASPIAKQRMTSINVSIAKIIVFR